MPRALRRIEQLVNAPQRIVAVDGEGVTTPDGKHHYVLLVARDGAGGLAVVGPAEGRTYLTSQECLDFLLSIPPDRTAVWFGGGYDTTKILQDVAPAQLEKIVADQYGYHRGVAIKYMRKRQLYLKDKRRAVTITDVLPYFQCSFIKALDEWQVGTQEERDLIRRLKGLRSDFYTQDQEEVLRYCVLECDLLVRLVHRLWSLLVDAGILPRAFYGVGPIASYLLENHKVDTYAKRDPMITPLADAAFFGGRFDLAAIGRIKDVWDYDINSAYPCALLQQPCLACGQWRRVARYEPRARVALWRVRWEVPRRTRWGPLPWRSASGGVWYPATGRGLYWDDEVRTAITAIERANGKWEIDRGIIYETTCTHRPFAWLQEVFDQRAAWKREGNPAERVLKLGPNACYGKLAQTVGYRRLDDGTVVPPRWRNAIWAGRVTAWTRAQLLAATLLDPEAIISHATDGIVTTRMLPLTLGEGLGEWKCKHYDDAWFIQPGVYTFGGAEHAKTRGHAARELDWSAITASWSRLEWLDDPTKGWNYETTRFVGLGAAVRGGSYTDKRGDWITVPRRVQFYPARRTVGDTVSDVRRNGYCNLQLPFWQGVTDSAPYRPAATPEERDKLLDDDQLWGEDQP